MKRPLGLTVISIFWFLGSLLNFFIGIGAINTDLESMPLLSNPSVPEVPIWTACRTDARRLCSYYCGHPNVHNLRIAE